MKTISSFLLLCLFIASGLESLGQHLPIQISSGVNEVSISINPRAPHQVIAGANVNAVYWSNDTGRTWLTSVLRSPYGVWGDPSVGFDKYGNAFYFHLSYPPVDIGWWIDRIVCQRSTDSGASWNEGSYIGFNESGGRIKAQDKEWHACDFRNNQLYVTWTQFDKYGSKSLLDSSIILFSSSTDDGASWASPKRLSSRAGDCVDSDETVEGAVPTVGPNGEIYVAWAGPSGLCFNTSIDGGTTWLKQEKVILGIAGGWNYDVEGLYRCNGLPITICDTSATATKGNIYINWSDDYFGAGDHDVWFIRSTDGGKTWTSRIRVNDDPPGAEQFMSWMSVDQVTGDVWVLYYDRREKNGIATSIYLAHSTDGGETWINQRLPRPSFSPNVIDFFGDYIGVASHAGIVRPIWMEQSEGKFSAWTCLVDTALFGKTTSVHESKSLFLPDGQFVEHGEELAAEFELHSPELVVWSLYSLDGQQVATSSRLCDAGENLAGINSRGFARGVYVMRIRSASVNNVRRFVVR